MSSRATLIARETSVLRTGGVNGLAPLAFLVIHGLPAMAGTGVIPVSSHCFLNGFYLILTPVLWKIELVIIHVFIIIKIRV